MQHPLKARRDGHQTQGLTLQHKQIEADSFEAFGVSLVMIENVGCQLDNDLKCGFLMNESKNEKWR
jgi:hypothetical protein